MFIKSSFALRHHPLQQRHLILLKVVDPESTKFINLFPSTFVAWLLQYSGSRVEDEDGFSSHK